MAYQPRPPEALIAALDGHGAPQGEDDRRLGRIIKDVQLTPPSAELVAAGLRYVERYGASRHRLGVMQFMTLASWLEDNVEFVAASAPAGEVSSAVVDTLRSAHRAGVTSLGRRTLRDLVQEMAASDDHPPEVRENLSLLAAELGLERPGRRDEPPAAAGEKGAADAEDQRAPWPPLHMFDDRSLKSSQELVHETVGALLEAMHDCVGDPEVLAGATTGQRRLTLALHYTNFVCCESGDLGDFLASESGWSAAEVADGLEALGFAATARLLRELMAGTPDEASISRLADQVALLWDQDRLVVAAGAYIRDHPHEFFLGPKPG